MTTIVNDVSDVGIYNIVADQGTTFMRTITYKNSAGTAIDLGVGASANMKVRKSYPATQNLAAYRDAPVLTLGTAVIIGTCTISNASPTVITFNNHGLANNDVVKFTTTGALPTGITADERYYVRNPATNSFNISTAAGGTLLNTSSAGSGVHTLYKSTINLTTSTGIIDIKIPSVTMAAVPAGIYDYDLEITLGTSPGVGQYGDTIKIIRGLFEVRQEMTY